MERIRAFFAIELSEAARRTAADAARALRARPAGDRVRWVRPEALHVTLRFLGEIAPNGADTAADHVGREAGALAPFEVALGPVRMFPSPRRPRVVALGIEPEEPLARLAEAVERGVVASGLEPEARRFHAHLTLGRLRGSRFPDAGDVTPAEPAAFPVREVVLFRSQPGGDGPVYTPLRRLALGGTNSP